MDINYDSITFTSKYTYFKDTLKAFYDFKDKQQQFTRYVKV